MEKENHNGLIPSEAELVKNADVWQVPLAKSKELFDSICKL